jgi:hypothetical protein
LAATSVSNLAIFASGSFNSSFMSSAVVDIYNTTSSNWTTASLSQAHHTLAATSLGSLDIFGGGQHGSTALSVVDIYNASANSWTTASLSQGHQYLAATSIGSLALFAGGNYGGVYSSMVATTHQPTAGPQPHSPRATCTWQPHPSATWPSLLEGTLVVLGSTHPWWTSTTRHPTPGPHQHSPRPA